MSHDRREPKRARQACLNCRRKKARCSGEKPVCAFCARLHQPCEWDSPTVDPPGRAPSVIRRTSSSTTAQQDTGLAARVALLEAKLSLLNDGSALSALAGSGPTESSSAGAGQVRKRREPEKEMTTDTTTPNKDNLTSLPPTHVFRHLIDVYFEYNHNQPYTYFHEASFRSSFEEGNLPEYLMFAFAATACRFSQHEFYQNRHLQVLSAYAGASWHLIYEGSFSHESSLDFAMVQATSMLAAIDFTSGYYKLGWVKFSLTIRFAQGLRLNEEPDEELPVIQQEERRRTFWSVYLLDALISLGPNRPRSIIDADCTVRLPCHEDLFRNGLISDFEPTLDAVLEDRTTQPHQNLDYFAMTILMAAALGRFIRLGMKRSPRIQYVVWDPRSPYYEVMSILLHFESLSPCALASVTETLQYQFTFDGVVDRQRAGHFLYSHAMFHLTHCLLSHPLIMYHLLQPCLVSIPPSFVQEALHRCHLHATELLTLLLDAQQYGQLVGSSFYGYCAMVSGLINRLYESHEDPRTAATSRERAKAALGFLEVKPVRWPLFEHLAMSLRCFKPDLDTSKALTSAVALSQKVQIKNGDVLWQLLDYARHSELNPLPKDVEPSPGETSQQDWSSKQASTAWTETSGSGSAGQFEDVNAMFPTECTPEGLWTPFMPTGEGSLEDFPPPD